MIIFCASKSPQNIYYLRNEDFESITLSGVAEFGNMCIRSYTGLIFITDAPMGYTYANDLTLSMSKGYYSPMQILVTDHKESPC